MLDARSNTPLLLVICMFQMRAWHTTSVATLGWHRQHANMLLLVALLAAGTLGAAAAVQVPTCDVGLKGHLSAVHGGLVDRYGAGYWTLVACAFSRSDVCDAAPGTPSEFHVGSEPASVVAYWMMTSCGVCHDYLIELCPEGTAAENSRVVDGYANDLVSGFARFGRLLTPKQVYIVDSIRVWTIKRRNELIGELAYKPTLRPYLSGAPISINWCPHDPSFRFGADGCTSDAGCAICQPTCQARAIAKGHVKGWSLCVKPNAREGCTCAYNI